MKIKNKKGKETIDKVPNDNEVQKLSTKLKKLTSTVLEFSEVMVEVEDGAKY